jgi:hypothetical protein
MNGRDVTDDVTGTGPLSSVSVFGQHLVIINDPQIAFELLEKKSSIYSDRPTLIFGGEMCVSLPRLISPSTLITDTPTHPHSHPPTHRCGWENTLALQHYSDRFRAYRKHMHAVLGSRAAIARFQPHLTTEIRRLMWRVWKEPGKLGGHIRT